MRSKLGMVAAIARFGMGLMSIGVAAFPHVFGNVTLTGQLTLIALGMLLFASTEQR